MEVNQQRRAAGLKDKMPDIQKTLETVQFLKSRKACYDFLIKSRSVTNDLLGGRRALGVFLRTQRHLVRKGTDTADRRGLSVARRACHPSISSLVLEADIF